MHDLVFSNKTVIITGGGGVLGGSIAKAFALQGADLVLLGRRKEVLDSKKEEILSECEAKVLCLTCDVLKKDDLQKAMANILGEFKTIDILVNAAGGNLKGATIAPDQTFFDLQVEAVSYTHLVVRANKKKIQKK